MQNFKYKLYHKNKRNSRLGELIVTSNYIWNYALTIQKLSYRIYGKYLSVSQLQKFIAKKRKRNSYWMKLNSQTVQGVVQKLDESYQRFFNKLQKAPPKFKKIRQGGSIRFTQSGFKLEDNKFQINKVGTFRFHKSCEYYNVKQIVVKKSGDRYFICMSCDIQPKKLSRACNGTVGLDFGLITFATKDTGETIASPRFLFQQVDKYRSLSKRLSKKQKGSNNRRRARKHLNNFHYHISCQREDWQWKLAHELCKSYDVICIEDLCLKGWIRLWGRKVSDLALGSFIQKLQYIATKYDTRVVKVVRFYASSHICSACEKKLDRKLLKSERSWTCPCCGVNHDRDVNAAINIKRQGIASLCDVKHTQRKTLRKARRSVEAQGIPAI